jgi:uncharacterized protein
MTFYLTFFIFAFMMLVMAVGVIFSGKTLKGSCGGVGGNCPCDEAGTPGACKVELEDEQDLATVTHSSHTQSDGVILYGNTPS